MKVIVAGSRNFSNYETVVNAIIDSGFAVTEIVSGCAKGVDFVGECIGELVGIPVKKFPANWHAYKKAAGPIRNEQMGNYADALVAIRLNGSKGTTHMINYMLALGKPVFVVDVKE